MTEPVEHRLYFATESGNVSEVSSLFSDNPGIDVNWTHDRGLTALHVASCQGHVEVVKLLLAYPNINVNVKDNSARTPLSLGCMSGQVTVVQLLKDPRVDVTLADLNGRTPLWASCAGRPEVIECLISSGRDLGDIKNKKGRDSGDGKDKTALEIARKNKQTEAVQLLERFIDNPTLTRHELRVKLGMLDELAAQLYAVPVFLCDDLLRLKPAPLVPTTTTTTTIAATRFFAIAFQLPMELQMILCHRVVWLNEAEHSSQGF